MVDSKGPGPSQPSSQTVVPAAPKGPAMPPPGVKPGSQARPEPSVDKPLPAPPSRKPEIGGPKGPDPTRYGDWEKGGRCIDF